MLRLHAANITIFFVLLLVREGNAEGAQAAHNLDAHYYRHRARASAGHNGTGSDYAAGVRLNVRNIGLESVNVTTAEGALQSSAWDESFKVYSVLRDTVANEVNVFYDAADWVLVHLAPSFINGSLPEWSWVNATYEVPGNCTRRDLHHMPRPFNGYSLTCHDPGLAYDKIAFRVEGEDMMSARILHAAFPIETIEAREHGAIGACLATMYSQPSIPIELWISDTLAIGVSGIHIYYTDLKLNESAFGVNGVRFGYADRYFVPHYHPNVEYVYYMPPLGRFYFGQTTAMNECIYRNRNKYKYIIMADADEFLTITQPGRHLEAVLADLLPPKAGGLLLEALLYPGRCQTEATAHIFEPGTTSAVATAHLYDQEYEPFRGPKSIVQPRQVRVLDVHAVTETVVEGVSGASADRRQLFFKHIQGGPGKCDPEYSKLLLDDRNHEQFVHGFLTHKDAPDYVKEEAMRVPENGSV